MIHFKVKAYEGTQIQGIKAEKVKVQGTEGARSLNDEALQAQRGEAPLACRENSQLVKWSVAGWV